MFILYALSISKKAIKYVYNYKRDVSKGNVKRMHMHIEIHLNENIEGRC